MLDMEAKTPRETAPWGNNFSTPRAFCGIANGAAAYHCGRQRIDLDHVLNAPGEAANNRRALGHGELCTPASSATDRDCGRSIRSTARRSRPRLSKPRGAPRHRLSARRADRHLRPPDRAVAVAAARPALRG